MPIEVERFAVGLYCQHWINEVTASDLQKVGDDTVALANADSVNQYVVLIDGTRVKQFPFNIRGYMGSVKSRNIGLFIFNAPFGGEVLGKMFNKLMPIRVEFYRDREKWLADAAAMLAQASAGQTHEG
jgi:hypothetical protein